MRCACVCPPVCPTFERSAEDDSTPLCIIQLADDAPGLRKTCLERLDMASACVCVRECVFNMVKRYILTRLVSQRGSRRGSWRAYEEHSNLFSTSSPTSYITRPFHFSSSGSSPRLRSPLTPAQTRPPVSGSIYVAIAFARNLHEPQKDPSRVLNSNWISCPPLDMQINMYIVSARSWHNVSFIGSSEHHPQLCYAT